MDSVKYAKLVSSATAILSNRAQKVDIATIPKKPRMDCSALMVHFQIKLAWLLPLNVLSVLQDNIVLRVSQQDHAMQVLYVSTELIHLSPSIG